MGNSPKITPGLQDDEKRKGHSRKSTRAVLPQAQSSSPSTGSQTLFPVSSWLLTQTREPARKPTTQQTSCVLRVPCRRTPRDTRGSSYVSPHPQPAPRRAGTRPALPRPAQPGAAPQAEARGDSASEAFTSDCPDPGARGPPVPACFRRPRRFLPACPGRGTREGEPRPSDSFGS